ncbi:hypothetical protein LTR12_003821 [Friedmanniomyces endolithicus]|nr:hypothetical protein LTR12_003821 [Friedmanniomyces endolithicus]
MPGSTAKEDVREASPPTAAPNDVPFDPYDERATMLCDDRSHLNTTDRDGIYMARKHCRHPKVTFMRASGTVHGKVTSPKAIPPPSLDVSGCGEVPSVLDALIRTRLSANTTNKNSSTAFQGLVKRFGTLSEGIGKGSVDWDAVRRAPQKQVFLAIERGGLADRKSRDIQAILQIAYDEGQERTATLASTGEVADGDGEH